MEVKYYETDINYIMKCFIGNFRDKEGKKLNLSEYNWFYDQAKGRVLFRLYIDEEKK